MIKRIFRILAQTDGEYFFNKEDWQFISLLKRGKFFPVNLEAMPATMTDGGLMISGNYIESICEDNIVISNDEDPNSEAQIMCLHWEDLSKRVIRDIYKFVKATYIG